MFKNLKSKIYKFINSRLYTEDRIDGAIAEGLKETLGVNEEGKLDLDKYDLFVYILEQFYDEELKDLEEMEPGSTENKVIGITQINEDETISVSFSRENIRNELFEYSNPISLYFEIVEMAKHEAYHVLQYKYLLEHGGKEAVNKVTAKIKESNYRDNIIEEGAYTYQFFNEKQDFDVVFAPYI